MSATGTQHRAVPMTRFQHVRDLTERLAVGGRAVVHSVVMTAEAAGPPEPSAEARDTEDAVLLERLRQGDDQAFQLLVGLWAAPMLRLALTQTRMRAVAEEAVQDTWLAVLQGIRGFEGRSSL